MLRARVYVSWTYKIHCQVCPHARGRSPPPAPRDGHGPYAGRQPQRALPGAERGRSLRPLSSDLRQGRGSASRMPPGANGALAVHLGGRARPLRPAPGGSRPPPAGPHHPRTRPRRRPPRHPAQPQQPGQRAGPPRPTPRGSSPPPTHPHCPRTPCTDQIPTLHSRHNLGLTLDDFGHHHEAVDLHRQVLSTYERILGPDHPSTLTSRSNLGLALDHLGHRQEAADHHQHVLSTGERILGPDHPHTLHSRDNLAAALHASGRAGTAMGHGRRRWLRGPRRS